MIFRSWIAEQAGKYRQGETLEIHQPSDTIAPLFLSEMNFAKSYVDPWFNCFRYGGLISIAFHGWNESIATFRENIYSISSDF